MTPATMRARHIDTQTWHVLTLSSAAVYWGMDLARCYNGDEGKPVDLEDYDSFEGTETMTDRLDQAIDAGADAGLDEMRAFALDEAMRALSEKDRVRAYVSRTERARAKAIIASILELTADEKQRLAWDDASGETFDAGRVDGHAEAIKNIRQRAGLEE
jgi:hypothetical protein